MTTTAIYQAMKDHERVDADGNPGGYNSYRWRCKCGAKAQSGASELHEAQQGFRAHVRRQLNRAQATR